MKKWLIAVAVLAALNLTSVTQAAPSGYGQFLASLDTIAGVAIPVAEEQAGPLLSGPAARVVAAGRTLMGSPVVWGGASPLSGFDCSGLVQYVFRQAGITLPRTADLQFLVGAAVSRTALRPGDLVYFTTYAPGASHVGIYIGADKFIHTSYSQGVVAVGDMNDDYFARRYYGAKRVV